MTAHLSNLSIKALYPLALAEGEGVGTAYEYFAKRIVLNRWLPRLSSPGDVLIAGLPQKYGASLDFMLLAQELGRSVTIVDDRLQALEKAQKALAAAQEIGRLNSVNPTWLALSDLSEISELSGRFALAVSSEVLQRLQPAGRPAYWQRLSQLAPAAAVFAPNADNPSHTTLSGLSGLHLDELRRLVGSTAESGYIDMPPFPPGMTRTEDQRERATSGPIEAVAMWGLGWYAHLEKVLPLTIRRRKAHIVFALSG